MDGKKLLKPLATLIIFIFFANFLANKFYWYSSIWYFDIFMHFLGGFWVGLFALYLFAPKNFVPVGIVKVLAFVLLIGLGWEIFEVSLDKAITANPFNLFDTSSDIFFDLAGGAAAIFYYLKKTASGILPGVQSS